MAEELGEEQARPDLAAAAFKLLLDQSLLETEDTLAEQAQERFEDERDGRPRRSHTRDFGPSQGMIRLYIDVGRDDGVRPADIVGAIANEAGIPGRATARSSCSSASHWWKCQAAWPKSAARATPHHHPRPQDR
ncbi:MAG: DbpA RNA binding domain-containing protein [Kouleothrix sp.]